MKVNRKQRTVALISVILSVIFLGLETVRQGLLFTKAGTYELRLYGLRLIEQYSSTGQIGFISIGSYSYILILVTLLVGFALFLAAKGK